MEGLLTFKHALATTCVACTLDWWLKVLCSLLESDTSKEQILEALAANKAVAYIADVSTVCDLLPGPQPWRPRPGGLWLKSLQALIPFKQIVQK